MHWLLFSAVDVADRPFLHSFDHDGLQIQYVFVLIQTNEVDMCFKPIKNVNSLD